MLVKHNLRNQSYTSEAQSGGKVTLVKQKSGETNLR